MSTFIAVCMGLNLDLPAAESLLASLSLGFEKTDRLDCAYMFLLTHYQGLCVEDCTVPPSGNLYPNSGKTAKRTEKPRPVAPQP